MINILLSTFNGSSYVPSFLSSLFSQSYLNWQLLIRDDGSTDNTQEIIKDFASKHPEKIKVIEDSFGNFGPCKSFLYLLIQAEGDYFMFADQDDVWLPQKIEKTLNKMIELEKAYGKNTPILVHTDLKVVDKNLNLITESFWKYQGLNPNYKSLNYLLVQNNITGCTVMINRALKDLIKTFPEKAIMHDWWLGLVASVFGVIDYIPESLILYRQHESQNTGARNYSFSYFYRRFIKNSSEAFNAILRTYEQAKEFKRIYENLLPADKNDILDAYISLFECSKFSIIRKVIKYKFLKQGLLKNIGFLGILILLKKHRDIALVRNKKIVEEKNYL